MPRSFRPLLPLICGALAVLAAPLHSQTVAPRAPSFAVASIKPCRADIPSDSRTGAGISSPALLDIRCQTVKSLIHMAYVAFATGRRVTPRNVTLEGGPAWIHSDRFDIQAKPETVETQMMMHGPMLQRLLEERFQLELHPATRDVPVFALTVDKGGHKLRPFPEGSCNPYDPGASFPPPPAPENPCVGRGEMKGGLMVIDVQAATLDEIAMFHLGGAGRPVLNRTGIPGRFHFHLEYAPDEIPDPSGPSIFVALRQQLGLKLEPTRGPGQYLVVDRVQRPSAN